MNLNPIEKYYPTVLGLLAFVLYSNTLFHQYCFDDNLVTSHHPLVEEGIKGIPEIFTSNYTVGFEKSFEYRPLTRALFAIEYELFDKNPFISHLVNVLLYSLTCALLYYLTISIFSSKGKLFALIGVLIFLVHPTHTEVVSSLKNREELLSFLFCISSTLFFIKGLKASDFRFYVLGSICFIMALFTKLTCLPFILVIPMCIYFINGYTIKNSLPVFGILLLLTGCFFIGTNWMLPGTYSRHVYFIENPIVIHNSFTEIILNGLQTMLTYIKLYVWPHPLSFYYGYDLLSVPKSITPPIVFSLLLHGLLVVYSLYKLKRRDVAAFAILFYLLNMSMYYNLAYPVPGIISDRALYVASFGFSLLISLFITHLSGPKKLLVCAVLIAPATVKTYTRNADWKDNWTLLSKDIGHLKRSVKANLEYASLVRNHWEKESNPEEKEKLAKKIMHHYAQSLEVKPDMANPYNEIGEILFNHYGRYQEAQPYFLKAIELNDSKAEFHFNLATGYVLQGEYNNAESSFLNTIKLEPDFTKALHNLFLVYMRQENYKRAFRTNSDLMDKASDEVYPYFNFGKYYIATGDSVSAKLYFEKADALSPGNSEIISILRSLNSPH